MERKPWIKFANDLNSRFDSIKFNVEQECEGKLAFLDILWERNDDGKAGRRVYRKRRTQICIWITIVIRMCTSHCRCRTLDTEQNYLQQVFCKNGYSWTEIKTNFVWHDIKRRRGKVREEVEELIRGVAVAPYCQTMTRLARYWAIEILGQHHIHNSRLSKLYAQLKIAWFLKYQVFT